MLHRSLRLVARRSSRRALSSSAAKEEPHLLVSVSDDGVATLTFNRPRARNAMTVAMGGEFERAVEDLAGRADVRAAVLTGRGAAFSAGGDLSFLLARADSTPAENAREMREFYGRFLSVRRLPFPVVAAINGHAVGAGLCLALACDARVAASRAKLGLTFSELALHPGMGATHFLPRLVGPETAARMLLGSEMHSGEEARRVGLVSEVVPCAAGERDEDVNARTLERATALAQKYASLSPVALRTITETLRNAGGEGLERALRREADAQAVCYSSAEYRAAVEAMQARVAGK